ncbi:MAG TPA: Hsp20/alpha crystallin family protein [Dongiaceae bacterium]|jgi:HSP20 family protein|nr:Hsp20/alpha crystallin family protein [Dongiaceae bacterium]
MNWKTLLPSGRNGSPASWDRDPFFAFQRNMSRVFEDMFRSMAPNDGDDDIGLRIDVNETDTGIELTAELPGVEENDISVELADDQLIIRGEKKSERTEKQQNFHVAERRYGMFQRAIPLPWQPEPDKVQARFEKGILHIALERPAEIQAKTRRIPISKS